MKKPLWYVAALVILLSILAACKQEAPAPPATPAAGQKSQARPAGEEKWDQLVAEARKEGKVVIYTAGPNEVKAALFEAFKKRYGIGLEFVSGRGAELAAKIENESPVGWVKRTGVREGSGRCANPPFGRQEGHRPFRSSFQSVGSRSPGDRHPSALNPPYGFPVKA